MYIPLTDLNLVIYQIIWTMKLMPLKGKSSSVFKVIEVRRDPNRTCFIALVAGWEGKRWILATENMKAGQIISTTCYIPESPQEGWKIFLRQNPGC